MMQYGINVPLFIRQPLGLAEQLFFVRGSTTLCTDVRCTADILLVDGKIRLQQLLHFAKRFGHRKSHQEVKEDQNNRNTPVPRRRS
ncbi:MAG: hypothetical protein HQ518_05115 [Rhodopirellula sp.]|nr:hypothetical protein [Rhodopirellula sp.]